jgi:hypothetical protein
VYRPPHNGGASAPLREEQSQSGHARPLSKDSGTPPFIEDTIPMKPVIHATHYSAEIVVGPWRENVPGTTGKEEMKILNHRVRARMHNTYIAKTYLAQAEAGLNRFSPALRVLQEKN